jgi:hypothetical protein
MTIMRLKKHSRSVLPLGMPNEGVAAPSLGFHAKRERKRTSERKTGFKSG